MALKRNAITTTYTHQSIMFMVQSYKAFSISFDAICLNQIHFSQINFAEIGYFFVATTKRCKSCVEATHKTHAIHTQANDIDRIWVFNNNHFSFVFSVIYLFYAVWVTIQTNCLVYARCMVVVVDLHLSILASIAWDFYMQIRYRDLCFYL